MPTNIKPLLSLTAVATFFAFGTLFLSSATSFAEIYTFTDARGVVHYTNVRTDPRYKLLSGIVSVNRPFSRNHFRAQYHGDRSFDVHIQDAAHHYDIDPMLIRAVIKQESNFNPNATSKKGALGLMQLMPGTARDMKVVDVFDPRENIFGGARYLKRLYSQFNGNLALTLASYNAGPERVYSSNGIPNIPETINYVRTVLSLYDNYKRYE